jgi:hypothetical protein
MLEAGRYYIGDLSVILTPEEVKHLEQFKDGYCSLPDGRTIAKFAVPNGVYRTSHGNSLSVSIGVIGVVAMNNKYSTSEYIMNINTYGMSEFMTEKFSVEMVNGDIKVGKLIIDTNNDAHFGGEEVEQEYIN